MLDYCPALVTALVEQSYKHDVFLNDSDLLQRVAKGVHEAPKFILPTGGFRNIEKITNTEIELFEPPYNNSVWEYHYPQAMQEEDCIERGADVNECSNAYTDRVCFLMKNQSRNHTDNDWLFCVFNKEKNKSWGMHPCSVGFSKEGISAKGIDTHPDFMEFVEKGKPEYFPVGYSMDDLKHELHKDIGYELATVIKAIAMLNCENVSHEPVNRPITTLKKNRFKKKYGLEPYQYRVLSISGERTYNHSGDISPRGEGVRFHLRRGHFRRLANGTVIWVRPCTVGDITKGRVEKVYKLNK